MRERSDLDFVTVFLMLHNFDVDPEGSALTAVVQGGCEDTGAPSVHTCLF